MSEYNFWAAVDAYVEACGGNPDSAINGTDKDELIANIEDASEEAGNVVLGLTVDQTEVDHRGVNWLRIARTQHRMESFFAREWEDRNDACLGCDDPHSLLDHLLTTDEKEPPSVVSKRDARTAATVAQWLGSEIGQGFLVDVFVRAALDENSLAQVQGFFKEVMSRVAASSEDRYNTLRNKIGELT